MHRLLSSDGSIQQIATDWVANAIVVGSDVSPETLQARVLDEQACTAVLIEFESASDGRGFSLVAQYRECHGHDRLLHASGALIPDQVALALQCGFNGIVVTQQQCDLYGEASWEQALTPMVNNSYVESSWRRIDSIWTQRRARAS